MSLEERKAVVQVGTGRAVRRCVRCIQTDTFPHIHFDAEGVCSLCRDFEKRIGRGSEFLDESLLVAQIDKARKRNPKFQVVVGLSGGKDSSYVVHLMAARFKAKVLAFTFDNGFLTDGARENIQILTRALHVEHRYVKADEDVRQRIHRALIRNRCADVCMACGNGAIGAANYLAIQEDIPLIAFGFSNKTEPIFPLEMVCAFDFRYFANAVKPLVGRSELWPYKYVDLPWMFYTMFIKRVRHIMMPDYVPWNDDDMRDVLTREYGWRDHGDGKAHFDCRIVNAVSYFLNQRFGTNLVVEKLSQMVRYGHLTREQAIEKLRAQDDWQRPDEAIRCLCETAGLDEGELKPYEEGVTRDFSQFGTYSIWFRRFSRLFWAMNKLGLISESVYYKYKL